MNKIKSKIRFNIWDLISFEDLNNLVDKQIMTGLTEIEYKLLKIGIDGQVELEVKGVIEENE